MKGTKEQRGITLVALVITIIVLLILAVVAIGAVRESGLIRRAQQTKFLSDIGQYKEELELYKINWAIEYQLNNRATTDEINNPKKINTWDYDEIKEKYIKSFAKKYKDKIGIKNGELVYQYIDNETEKEWAEQSGLGIESKEITIEVGADGLGTITSSIEIKDGKIATKKGQTITITATPGRIGEGENTLAATFKGWYNGETLITDKLSYTFKVAGNQTLTAKFEIETDATIIYYLDEKGREQVELNKNKTITGYSNRGDITKVEIQDGVTISDNTFVGCTNLQEVIIGDNVGVTTGTWKPGVFSNCTNLKNVTMGENIKFAGGAGSSSADCQMFYNCTSLENVTVKSISQIVKWTFYNVGAALKGDIVLNEGITTIGLAAFMNCSNIETIHMANSVTKVDGSAFSGCSGTTNVVLSNALESIANSGFKDCRGIKGELVIKEGMTIDIDAFSGTGITSLIVGNNVKIPSKSFVGCTDLNKVTIGDNVTINTGWSDGPFSNCTSLKNVTMGENIKFPGGNSNGYTQMFYNCTVLENVTVKSISEIGTWTFNSVGKALKGDIVLNEGITTIGLAAFMNCSNIETIHMANSVTKVDGSAFLGCSGTTNVVLSNALESIADSGFKDCRGIKGELVIKEGMTIGMSAFSGTGITSLKIENNVTIPDNSFVSCEDLQEITIGDNVIILTATWKAGVFSNCTNLKNVTMGENIKFAGGAGSSNAECQMFYNCTSLENVTVKSISQIVKWTFYNVGGALKGEIVINEEVTDIGLAAFYNCTGITNIKVDMTKEEFANVTKGNAWDYNVTAPITYLK